MNHATKFPGTFFRKATGPLIPYVDSFVELLREQGYGKCSSCQQIRLVFDFSRWLGEKGVAIGQLSVDQNASYLRHRSRHRRPKKGDQSTLRRLLELLRRTGVVPEECAAPAPKTPAERYTERYASYLQRDRALAASTIVAYCGFAVPFLTACFGSGQVRLKDLRAIDVIRFVQNQARHLQPKRAHLLTVAMRSLLRYARYQGDIKLDLASAVPRVALGTVGLVPRAISRQHIDAVLAHCDRRCPMGRRDFAILLMLARLGLRAGEIAALTLEDIDWQAGHISIRGKGNRPCRLPLPPDVGQAIVDYLRHGRPRGSGSRSVFLRAKAPFDGFSGQQSVGAIVKHALERADVQSCSKGAHQFRHALATQMLQNGASLGEIGDLLRHRRVDTTRIYAKVDLTSLRTLALPWPGGAP
jgi:site-specific recombinase XerD